MSRLDSILREFTADDLRELLQGVDRAVLQDAIRYREIRDHSCPISGSAAYVTLRGEDLDERVDHHRDLRTFQENERSKLSKTLEAADRAGSLPNSGQPGYSSGGFQPVLPDSKIIEGGILKRQEQPAKEPNRQYYETPEDYSGL